MSSNSELGSNEAATSFESALADANSSMTIRSISKRLDRLEISADAKAILLDIARLTMKVGEAVIALGRKILSVVFEIVDRFPNTIFAVIIAFVISALIGSVPLVGVLLAAFLKPLLIALGLAVGSFADMASSAARARVSALERQFTLLAGRAQV